MVVWFFVLKTADIVNKTIQIRQKQKAVMTAKELLEKQVKIESTAIAEIKAEMEKIILKILVLTVLVSCQNEEEIRILDTKSDIKILSGKIHFPVVAKLAADIVEIDTLLAVCTPFDKDGIFTAFSKVTGRVKYTFNKRGKGPGEYLQPNIDQYGIDTISFWDINKMFSEILFELNPDGKNIYKSLNSLKIKKGGMKVCRFNTELLISNIHDQGMFALFNNKGELVGDYFGKKPLREDIGYDRFQGRLAVSPLRSMFVFGTYDLGYLCAYEINKKYQPILKWEFYLQQKPFYSFINGKFKWNNEKHVQGIKDIQISNDKIFILYSGRSISLPGNKPEGAFSDNLYVLNLEGKILDKYKLDIPILKLHFSQADKALYGITVINDWQIVKFCGDNF